jgi:Tfp pilus assembly protein PilE
MSKAFLSILISVGLSLGMYVVYVKSISGGKPGATPMAAVSGTSVKMQLLNIAQAEKTYYVQNNSYATMDQLISSGWFTPKNPDPTGYTYTIAVAAADPTPAGFTITATHPPAPNGSTADYPSMSINQDMKVSGDD